MKSKQVVWYWIYILNHCTCNCNYYICLPSHKIRGSWNGCFDFGSDNFECIGRAPALKLHPRKSNFYSNGGSLLLHCHNAILMIIPPLTHSHTCKHTNLYTIVASKRMMVIIFRFIFHFVFQNKYDSCKSCYILINSTSKLATIRY